MTKNDTENLHLCIFLRIYLLLFNYSSLIQAFQKLGFQLMEIMVY